MPAGAMTKPRIKCESCDEKFLERTETEEGHAWVCPRFKKAARGVGCGIIVSEELYAQMQRDFEQEQEAAVRIAQEEEKRQRASSVLAPQDSGGNIAAVDGEPRKVKRRKASEEGAHSAMHDSDSESDDAGGDLAANGDWEEFDAMPEQIVDVREVKDVIRGQRAPVIGFLSLSAVDMVLKGAFVAPRGADSRQLRSIAHDEGAPNNNKKRLGMRMPMSSMNVKPGEHAARRFPIKEEPKKVARATEEEMNLEPLVLWEPSEEQVAALATAEAAAAAATESAEGGPAALRVRPEYQHKFVRHNQREVQQYRIDKSLTPFCVVVEPWMCRFLREHQRQGVQFMFECVAGLRKDKFNGEGCILADDMGLGKTFQSVVLLWTMLTQGMMGKPTVKRAAIICPTSLVKNWAAEIIKWLGDRLEGGVLALSESSRENVIEALNQYTMQGVYKREQKYPPVLIISYDTFRLHYERLVNNGPELIICDEAHRLKNNETKTNVALAALPCTRRVLLSGTPMQNDLEEFFSMVDFTNPGVLGDVKNFRKIYSNPILRGREPDASEKDREKGQAAQAALSGLANNFILRRTNELLQKHLPPKTVQVVCCKLTPLQQQLYKTITESKDVLRMCKTGKATKMVLSTITALKKLCNHPKLIYDAIRASSTAGNSGEASMAGLEECIPHFPDEYSAGRGAQNNPMSDHSGKMAVLEKMLHILYHEKKERIVLISNYTQTLDVFQNICRSCGYPFVRLDGTTAVKKRQKIVDVFNDPSSHQFAFLLSSKAGGCGINLVGASRLILFDPDWNPACDKQAMARVWRDGQKRRVFEYRFFGTGTIEEKVFQRQLSKEGLQGGLFEAELAIQKCVSSHAHAQRHPQKIFPLPRLICLAPCV